MSLRDSLLDHPWCYRMVSSLVDRYKLRAIGRLREDFSGLRVLDLGCGIGNAVCLFKGSDYTGIDINRRYISISSRSYPGLNFIAGDVIRLEWGEGFDIILVNSFLHHLDDGQALKILEKSSNALRPEGRVIVQEPLLARNRDWVGRLMESLDRGKYFRTREEWDKLFGRAGLLPVNVDHYSMRIFGFEAYKMISVSLGRPSDDPSIRSG
jgi:SAM-dependent methyltransferase